jgi:non-haem dioxygenase in morphine synthesis N-terminal
LSEQEIVQQIATACQTYGFFQITSHGISHELIRQFQQVCRDFFQNTSMDEMYKLKRNENNARGFFDDELTKQRLDWKHCLDVGVPGSRDWARPDSDRANACLDGCNQFPQQPPRDGASNYFRTVLVEYFDECAKLSHRIATYMARGLLLLRTSNDGDIGDDTIEGGTDDTNNRKVLRQLSDDFLRQMWESHTSYLRVNYYPPCPGPPPRQQEGDDDAGPLGVRWTWYSECARVGFGFPILSHARICVCVCVRADQPAQGRGIPDDPAAGRGLPFLAGVGRVRAGLVHGDSGSQRADGQHGRHGPGVEQRLVQGPAPPGADAPIESETFGPLLLQSRVQHVGVADRVETINNNANANANTNFNVVAVKGRRRQRG